MARPGDRIDGYFLVENDAGQAADADALPTVDVRREGVTGNAAAVTRISLGSYYYYFDVPTTWVVGDSLAAYAAVVIAGVTYARVVKAWEIQSGLTPPTAEDCLVREVVRPEVARMEKPVPQRRQAVRVWQGQTAIVELVFRDDGGRPVDLSPYLASDGYPVFGSSSSTPDTPCSPYDSGHDYRLLVRLKEPFDAGTDVLEVEGYAFDARKGVVRYVLPAAAVAENQLLFADVALVDGGHFIRGLQSLVAVDRFGFGAGYKRQGVPTTAEVRTRLRDSGVNDNYLLARLEHSLDEISEATVMAVAQWNQWFRNSGQGGFTTKNFPDPDNLMDGVMANLYPMLSDNYRRNHLEYAAAGVSVNDKNYGSIYDQLAQTYRLQFDKTARRLAAAGARAGWGQGIVGSPYGRLWGGRGRW